MNSVRRIRLNRPKFEDTVTVVPDDTVITESSEPELHIFPADPANSKNIGAIVCPGGGYGVLALGAEGHACGRWLASMGITGMVLQYRLPHGDKTIPHADIQAAMHYARTNAEALGFSPDKLGVVGFSAGGHLAAHASTVYAKKPVSTRPDFTVLFYPVISMEKRKRGSTRLNLLGRRPSEQDIADYSCHCRVDKKTPPALLFLCDDDPLVPPRQSLLYYEALKQHGVAASMHIFPEGGHAWGFAGKNMDGVPFRYGETVSRLMADWIGRVAAP